MLERIAHINEALDRDNLRVERPDHFIFLCGGGVASDRNQSKVLSLRDYLCRKKRIEEKIGARIVLAEEAQQLYRDTNYPDLITFEEDIARIASVVLVISESAGSLAELGSFSSEQQIREVLRVIISEEHEQAESFVRFGPVERLIQLNRDRVGVFPWRTHKAGHLIKSSMNGHYPEMTAFISRSVASAPKTLAYPNLNDSAVFYDLMWLIFVCKAIAPDPLNDAIRIFHPALSDSEIRNKLFCLRLAGWIGKVSYSNKDYYFSLRGESPYEYAFREGMRIRDMDGELFQLSSSAKKDHQIPDAVYRRITDAKAEI